MNVGFFASSLANPYIAAQAQAAEEEAKKLGVSIELFDAQTDPAKQGEQIQNAANSGKFQAFVVSPQDGNAIVPQLEVAIEKGIKVGCITAQCGPNFDTLEPQIEGQTIYVGQLPGESGTRIAKLIGEACKGIDPCKVVYMPGSFSFAPEASRSKDFEAQIAKYPNVEVIEKDIAGEYETEPARAAMAQILNAQPEINVVATPADQMTLGVQKAIEAAGRSEEIKIVSAGAGKEGTERIRNGEWVSAVVYDPRVEAGVAMQGVVAAARGENGPSGGVDELEFSPIGEFATKQSLSTPEGKEFVGAP